MHTMESWSDTSQSSQSWSTITSSGCLTGTGVEGAGGADAGGGELPCFRLFRVRYVARATANRVTRTDWKLKTHQRPHQYVLSKLKRHHQMFFSPLKMVSKIPSDLPVEKKTAEHGGDDARVVCRAGGEKRQESCRHNLRFEKLEIWLTIWRLTCPEGGWLKVTVGLCR